MKEVTKLRWWIQIIAEIRRAGFSRCRDIQPLYFTDPLTGFCIIQTVFTYAPGLRTRPIKRTAPVSMSRIRKMKGRSMLTSTGGSGTAVNFIITAVAAAASVPASSTATKLTITCHSREIRVTRKGYRHTHLGEGISQAEF